MSPLNRKTFWFDQMVKECVAYFGWREDVAAYAIMTNRPLIEGLLNQHEHLQVACNNIESVFTNLLKQGETNT